MNKNTSPGKKLYLFLFLIAALGFSYEFSTFVKSNINYVSKGSVAGAFNENVPVTVELRTNNKVLAEEVLTNLSSYKEATVLKITLISKSYENDMLVDLSNGSKVIAISGLENEVKIGATKELPEGELPSDAEVVLIITTK